MGITIALLRLAFCLFVALLPFAAIQAEMMIRVVSMGLVLSLIAALFIACIELALMVIGRPSVLSNED